MFLPGLRAIFDSWFRLPPLHAVPSSRGVGVATLRRYATTSIPIERAVPFTLLIAASSDAAFRSGIFCLAISATCFSVTLPTLSLFGDPEPFAMLAARLSNMEAGGVLVIKVNERSVYTVI